MSFDAPHLPWIGANHLPVVRGTDNAIWNRLHPIPFSIVIPEEAQKRKPSSPGAGGAGVFETAQDFWSVSIWE